MTARTRQAALCMEAAERDLRATTTWNQFEHVARQIGELCGVKHFEPMPAPITRKVARLTHPSVPCALCNGSPYDCDCDPDASWQATYAKFKNNTAAIDRIRAERLAEEGRNHG